MKILSNKKYNELILKSCKGMFGTVIDDMLLRNNALLNEENKQLKEQIQKYKEVIDKAKEKLIELAKNFKQEEHIGTAYDDDIFYEELFEIFKEVE